MVHISIYANDVALNHVPRTAGTPIRSTFHLDLHMYVYHGCLIAEESVNGGIVLAEEREARLARRRVRDIALRLLPSEKKLYNVEGSADSAQSLRTYVRTSAYIYVCTAAYARP